jgi:hypothetical protein
MANRLHRKGTKLQMKITDLKNTLDFTVDAIYQKGYDLGFESVLEELELIADSWWNNGFTTPAEMLRMEIKKLRGDNVL